jgi:hypothetical protein
VVTAFVTVKIAVDLVLAPLWALAWYSAPQRLLLPFGATLVALAGGATLDWVRPPVPTLVRVAAMVPLAVLVLPPDVAHPRDSGSDVRRGSWQDAIDEAADWVLAQGPPGRYGAYDAGLLAYRLDGHRTVTNLDGLVNDYEFAALVTSGAGVRPRVHAEGVQMLVQRVPDDQRAGELACATELWRSSWAVTYADGFTPRTDAPVYVLDVRACTR